MRKKRLKKINPPKKNISKSIMDDFTRNHLRIVESDQSKVLFSGFCSEMLQCTKSFIEAQQCEGECIWKMSDAEQWLKDHGYM